MTLIKNYEDICFCSFISILLLHSFFIIIALYYRIYFSEIILHDNASPLIGLFFLKSSLLFPFYFPGEI